MQPAPPFGHRAAWAIRYFAAYGVSDQSATLIVSHYSSSHLQQSSLLKTSAAVVFVYERVLDRREDVFRRPALRALELRDSIGELGRADAAVEFVRYDAHRRTRGRCRRRNTQEACCSRLQARYRSLPCPFRFALLEENNGRIAMPAVIHDLAHERPALLADEHTAVVDMPRMEIDLLTAVGACDARGAYSACFLSHD